MPSLFEPKTAQEIISRINSLQSTTQRKWGKMDVAQMLWHCNKTLGTATGDVATKPSFFLRLMQPMIRKMVLSPKPYKESLPTGKEFLIKSDKNFEQEKQNLLERINKFIANGESKVDGLVHPAFGKLTAEQWGYSQWKHFDHHLRQFGA